MKTKTATRTGKARKTLSTHGRETEHYTGKSVVMESHESKSVCKHCGGMMRKEPDGAVCVMCGRSESHKCDSCMYLEKKSAA